LDIEYGVDLAARATADIGSLPKSIWGKASTDISGWRTSARAEMKDGALDEADIELTADNTENDIGVKMVASAGKRSGFSVSRVEATKGMDVDGARVTVNPRYNVDAEDGDVVVSYTKDNTEVEVTASKDAQTVMVSQQIDDDNRVSPSVSRNGDISLEWERKLGDESTVTTTLRPNQAVDVEWKDNAWTANINVPIDGTNIGGTNVSIKRDVSF
jgi:predicted PilT family ATPase